MREKILVVDDNLPSGETMMWAMEQHGHEVMLAQDGASALQKVKRFIPTVVLCDICMPEMLGYDVCAAMKRDPRLKETLFIALTGIDTQSGKKRALDSGFAHHMVKPVDIDSLLRLIEMERGKLLLSEAV